MLRVAMLSFAHVHANGYAEHVAKHPEAKLQVIWEDDEGRAKAAHEKFQVPVSMDLEAVLSDPQVDAVVINSYTSQHQQKFTLFSPCYSILIIQCFMWLDFSTSAGERRMIPG